MSVIKGTQEADTWVVVAPQGQVLQQELSTIDGATACCTRDKEERVWSRQVLEPTGLTGRQDEIRGESW